MKTYQSVTAILALSSIAFAGGNINPVTHYEDTDVQASQEVEVIQEPVVVPKVEIEEKPMIPVEVAPIASALLGGYVGLAATGIADRTTCNGAQSNVFKSLECQDRQLGLTGVAGYDFNENLGVEARGTKGQWKIDGSNKFKNVGAYLKPQVDLGGVNLYGLAGYAITGGGSTITGDKEGDFSYGAGLDVPVSDNIKLFGDLVQYIDKGKDNAMGASAGIKYLF